MARFDFQSPGAAFTQSIAESLAQRKAEERQMILDQLTVNAEQRAQQRAAEQAAEHETQLAGMKQSNELNQLEVIRQGLQPGETPTDPMHAALLERWGFMKDQPQPSVSTSTVMDGQEIDRQAATPPPPPRRGYVGSRQDMDRIRKRDQSAALIFSLHQQGKTEEAKALESLAMVNDGIVPEAAATKYIAPPTRGILLDHATGGFSLNGKPVDASNLGPNDQVFVRPREPYRAPRSYQMAGYDKDGNRIIFDQETGTTKTLTGVFSGNQNKQEALAGLGVPNAYLEDINNRESAMLQNPTPESINGYRGVLIRGLGNAKGIKSEAARQAVIASLQGTELGIQRMRELAQQGRFGEQDMQEYERVMNDAIPEYVRELLNPTEAPKLGPIDRMMNWWNGKK